jgi:hypothetical protein
VTDKHDSIVAKLFVNPDIFQRYLGKIARLSHKSHRLIQSLDLSGVGCQLSVHWHITPLGCASKSKNNPTPKLTRRKTNKPKQIKNPIQLIYLNLTTFTTIGKDAGHG